MMYCVLRTFYGNAELDGIYDSYEKAKAAIEEFAARVGNSIREDDPYNFTMLDGWHSYDGGFRIYKTEMNKKLESQIWPEDEEEGEEEEEEVVSHMFSDVLDLLSRDPSWESGQVEIDFNH